jgi:hypothetical protein
MSAGRPIVSLQNMYTHQVNIMFEPIMNNLLIVMPAIWAGFGTYAVWYIARAKHYSAITPVEARTLWHIHHQTVHCNSRRWRKIRRRGIIVGFQCECGYKHIQKRPLVSHPPTTLINTHTNTFDRIHTSHN